VKKLTYVEIPATDAARAARFYETVLGWTVEVREDGAPRIAHEALQLIGRFTTLYAAHEPGIVSYFYVDNVRTAVGRVVELGGSVVAGPELDGDVLLARLRDSEGNLIGIWQFA
jgi:predicted enzyme related to lactoylglutathione lyase